MFSTCSELTPRAPIPDGRMAQIMQPCFELPDRAEVAVHVGGQVASVLLHELPQHHLSLHLKKPQLCRFLLMACNIWRIDDI